MPLASLTRDIVQTLIGRGMTEDDFAQLLLLQAEASGMTLAPENVPVGDGLGETDERLCERGQGGDDDESRTHRGIAFAAVMRCGGAGAQGWPIESR